MINSNPIPEIYILWHRHCVIGEMLAQRIHGWLRPGDGLGPDVFYRSLPAPDVGEDELPLPIPGENRGGIFRSSKVETNVQILIPLIDAHLIADSLWREWLRKLGEIQSIVALPVALDNTAYNVSGSIRSLNFLRPSGLPLDPKCDDASCETVVRSLLKQLTESLCRLMLYAGVDNPEADINDRSRFQPKLKIFLSHAKEDGVGPAKRLRDYIYGQTQLAAFFDENDIAFGSSFSSIIESDLRARETAALIAVRSTQYASRPWCRRELSLFRKPRLIGTSGNQVERWKLHPTLVVDALNTANQTLGVPEFGNAPYLRWEDEVGREEVVISSLLRDVMLASFHAALGQEVAHKASPGSIVLNWLPDPLSILHLPKVRNNNCEFDIAYPGRGLSGAELDILSEAFPKITFLSFEHITS